MAERSSFHKGGSTICFQLNRMHKYEHMLIATISRHSPTPLRLTEATLNITLEHLGNGTAKVRVQTRTSSICGQQALADLFVVNKRVL